MRVGRLWPVLVVAVAVFLYYRPLTTFLETRSDLAARRADVAELQEERALLERRLRASTSLEAIARESRTLGYVRPGERLFIVKGIPAWRRAQRDDSR